MVLTSRSVLAQSMRELIRIRIEALKDNMAFGGGVASFEAYRELVGEARGLQEAYELIDEAERLLDERERGR